MARRIIAVFLVFVTIFLMVPFASADNVSAPSNLWDSTWAGLVAGTDGVAWVNGVLSLAGHAFTGTVCALSDDKHHHADSINRNDFKVDGDKYSYAAICKFCGDKFYVTSNDFKAAYEDYTQSLPSNGYSSDNSVLWYPTIDDFYGTTVQLLNWRSGYTSTRESAPLPFTSFSGKYYSFSSGSKGRSIHVETLGSSSISLGYLGVGDLYFSAPCSGSYRRIESCAASAGTLNGDGVTRRFTQMYTSGSYAHVEKGFGIKSASCYGPSSSQGSYVYISGNQYLPVFSVIPDTVVEGSTPEYTKIYAPVTRVQNNIVNEITNVYTNPTTGEEKTINNWNYNYNDRSYDLHLADGMTVNVTFGDLNISIGETTVNENGDTVYKDYTVIYKVETTPDPSPSPSPSPSVPDKPSGPSRVFENYAHRITQHYGNEGHNGVDVVPVSGAADTVIAHSEGEIVTVQTGQVNDTSATGAASWGNYVKILHPNGMYTLYAHLASVDVHEGDHVYRGQPLGLMGDTGRAFGAHLHFEVYEAETSRINPEPYLNADLPGMGTEEDGWTWWKGAWSDFRSWLSGTMGKPDDMDTIFVPGVDSGGEGEEDSEWSFLDLLKAIVDGIWKFIKGVPGAIFGGLSGLIDGFVGIGDFFDAYGRNNPEGVWNAFTQGGEDLWD